MFRFKTKHKAMALPIRCKTYFDPPCNPCWTEETPDCCDKTNELLEGVILELKKPRAIGVLSVCLRRLLAPICTSSSQTFDIGDYTITYSGIDATNGTHQFIHDGVDSEIFEGMILAMMKPQTSSSMNAMLHFTSAYVHDYQIISDTRLIVWLDISQLSTDIPSVCATGLDYQGTLDMLQGAWASTSIGIPQAVSAFQMIVTQFKEVTPIEEYKLQETKLLNEDGSISVLFHTLGTNTPFTPLPTDIISPCEPQIPTKGFGFYCYERGGYDCVQVVWQINNDNSIQFFLDGIEIPSSELKPCTGDSEMATSPSFSTASVQYGTRTLNFQAKNTGSNYNLGDFLVKTETFDVQNPSVVTALSWYNLSQDVDITPAPPIISDIEQVKGDRVLLGQETLKYGQNPASLGSIPNGVNFAEIHVFNHDSIYDVDGTSPDPVNFSGRRVNDGATFELESFNEIKNFLIRTISASPASAAYVDVNYYYLFTSEGND